MIQFAFYPLFTYLFIYITFFFLLIGLQDNFVVSDASILLLLPYLPCGPFQNRVVSLQDALFDVLNGIIALSLFALSHFGAMMKQT